MTLVLLSQTQSLKNSRTVISFFQRYSYARTCNIRLVINVQQKGFLGLSSKSIGPCTYLYTGHLSLSKSRNTLIDYIISDDSLHPNAYCAFVDDDIVLPDLDFALFNLSHYEHYSKPLLIVGEIRCPSTNLFSRHINHSLQPRYLSWRHINYILGSAIFVRKTDLNSFGYFNEDMGLGTFFGGSEETEFFIRQLISHYQVIYEPAWIICHEDPKYINYSFHSMRSYGRGRGFLYKNKFVEKPFRITYFIVRDLILNLLGILIALIVFQPGLMRRQAGLLLGKVEALLMVTPL